ncbi:MAG: hypothetical protein QM706_01400 [Nitrospira sp.]
MIEDDAELYAMLEEYATVLTEWMRDHGPSAMREQLHLDADSAVCEFWRHGYLKALQDLQSLIRSHDIRELFPRQGTSRMFH